MRFWRFAFLMAVFGLWLASPAQSQTVTFDFDTGSPALTAGQGTPFDQTAGGITAHFSSPSDGGYTPSAYSVQNQNTTFFVLSLFSGNYLYPDSVYKAALDIQFSQPITRITFPFATADFQQVEIPSPLQVNAYVDSTSNPVVGTATAHGTYASDTMPMGTLTLDSGGKPFNLVEIFLPYYPNGASDFLVDTITVTPASTSTIATHITNVTPTSAKIAQKVTIKAKLTVSTSAGALAGQTLSFSLGGAPIGTAITGVTGVASLSYSVPESLGLGPQTLTIDFAGTSTYKPCHWTGTLTINQGVPKLTVTNVSGYAARTVTLKATLKNALSLPLASRTLTFTVNGVSAGSATTNASGVATISYTIPAGTPSTTILPVTVSFAGDTLYVAFSKTGKITVK